MSDEPITTHTIINHRFGGRRDVAEVTGAAPNAVAQWYRVGIPAKFWPTLVKAAGARGLSDITFDSLANAQKSPVDRLAAAQASEVAA